ncbi:hypothetical protein P691DRAFT_772755 [Macrolepiota fuliginosa MF-IS2]|uniref:Zn(2)-C6 fungal-type domain-containing protein n=1 Tax=Macrolepiota fuliginosa MF-IS2 TaxID=1400762 RepID=A0A9P5XIA3_9AGAR|nr:hypothetical protein P691DRAFT_772755 [Macrolepiota fuliginosa MF-IS2]
MPPVPKSKPSSATTASASPSKRPGSPKAKGAVRAKSGCYTCRIRRKKCDEQPNEQGHCSTCARLRLECLGFGAKRPDWLRESHNVLQLRDKIKNFLASQGMIKGHSSSGPRSTEEPTVLRLTPSEPEGPWRPSDGASVPSHTLSNDGTSASSRTLTNDEYKYSIRAHISDTPGSSLSVLDKSSSHAHGRHHFHPPTKHSGHLDSAKSKEPFSSNEPSGLPAAWGDVGKDPFHTPSSSLKQPRVWTMDDLETMMDASLLQNRHGRPMIQDDATAGNDGSTSPFKRTIEPLSHSEEEINTKHSTPRSRFLAFYRRYVIPQQYPLATPYIRWIVSTSIDNESICEQAVMLLLFVYLFRSMSPTAKLALPPDARYQTSHIERTLRSHRKLLAADDAMAALHLVSTITFDSRQGNWQEHLETAALYAKARMGGNRTGFEELRKLSQKDAFIVKTTIWLDVLASVTTREEPLLLEITKFLFGPGRSGQSEPLAASPPVGKNSASHDSSEAHDTTEEQESMLSPMGCENKVVWALAEISALSSRKKASKQDESSKLEFVQCIKDIEHELKGYHPTKTLSDFNGDPFAYSRYLTAHIFRTAALLYLHAVVLDGIPGARQIKLAVDEVMYWIHRIPKKPKTAIDWKIHSTVIRSTIFPFYITGALAEDRGTWTALNEYLLEEADTVGSCMTTAMLLENIWDERAEDSDGEERVPWRERLSEDGNLMLLA